VIYYWTYHGVSVVVSTLWTFFKYQNCDVMCYVPSLTVRSYCIQCRVWCATVYECLFELSIYWLSQCTILILIHIFVTMVLNLKEVWIVQNWQVPTYDSSTVIKLANRNTTYDFWFFVLLWILRRLGNNSGYVRFGDKYIIIR
jgi:hypothetical protein